MSIVNKTTRKPKSLYKWLYTPRVFQLLDVWECGWGDGGCAMLAEALRRVIGPSAGLWSFRRSNGVIDHVLCRVGEYLIDQDGIGTLPEKLRTWAKREHIDHPVFSVAVTASEIVADDEIPYAESTIRQLAALLREDAEHIKELQRNAREMIDNLETKPNPQTRFHGLTLVFGSDEYPLDEYTADDPWRVAQAAGVYTSKDFLCGYVCEAGNLVAVAFFNLMGRAYSFDVAVLPEDQGKGLGSALVDILLDDAQEYIAAGVVELIEADVINPAMRSILEKRGFTVCASRHDSRWLMVKDVSEEAEAQSEEMETWNNPAVGHLGTENGTYAGATNSDQIAWDTDTPETFRFGTKAFDVQDAKKIICKKPRALDTVSVQEAARMRIMIRIRQDTDENSPCDLTVPILVAQPKFGKETFGLIIDGWHRLEVARKRGIDTLPAVVLTESETKRICK